MKAPDKIYVAESDKIVGHIEHHIFSESPFQRNSSIEYIRKEKILEVLGSFSNPTTKLFVQSIIESLNEVK